MLMRQLLVLLFTLLNLTLSGQSYVYQWYFNTNNDIIILDNVFVDTIRININKPIEIRQARYFIDIYTVGKAFRITTDKYKDTTAWIGSVNRDSIQRYPFSKGYAYYKDGKEISIELPCDSIPEGYFGFYNFQWNQNSEDCYDYFRYELTSYNSEMFTIHFNPYNRNILYLLIQVEEVGDLTSVRDIQITESTFLDYMVYDLMGNRVHRFQEIVSGVYILVRGGEVCKIYIPSPQY